MPDKINGIPIIWDAIEENGLFGKFASQTQSFTSIPNSLPGIGAPSAFESSPFGSNWQLDNRYRKSYKPGIYDEDEKDSSPDPKASIDPKNYNRLLVVHGEEDAIRYWKNELFTEPRTIAAYFLVQKSLWLRDYAGKAKDIKIGYNFTAASVNKSIGVRLGYEITEKELSDSDISQLVQYLVEWLFINDKDAQQLYFAELNAMALAEYQSLHKYDLKWYEQLLFILAKVLGPVIKLLMKFIAFLLEKLAGLIKQLKIEDPKYWVKGHKNEKGIDDYSPFFFPSMAEITPTQMLEVIKKPFDEIDARIISFLGSNHKEIKADHRDIDKHRNGILKAMSFYYELFKEPFVTIYGLLHSFFEGVEEIISQVNAFMVGIYNGFINFVAGMIDGIKLLFEEGGLAKIINGIKAVVKEIQEKGFIQFLGDTIKTIFNHFKEKYAGLDNSYDILKSLGEDIIEIVLNVILAVEAGVSLFNKIKELLNKIINVIKKPGVLLEDIKGLLKESADEKPKGGKGPEGIGFIIGKYSKRAFDPKNAGGELLELSWKDARITRKGIETVKKHVNRFDFDEWNKQMIDQLEKILNKELEITDFDKRFYTHEIREFERYKALGHENTPSHKIPNYEEVWNNTHTATLEEYQIYEKMEFEGKTIRSLYHPSVQF